MSNTDQNRHPSKGTHTSAATRNLSLVLCLGALAGILIWAKLRLVTDIPRSAYADPREHQLTDEQGDQSSDAQVEADRGSADSDEPRETHP